MPSTRETQTEFPAPGVGCSPAHPLQAPQELTNGMEALCLSQLSHSNKQLKKKYSKNSSFLLSSLTAVLILNH